MISILRISQTDRFTLVLFKNIDIWPINGPKSIKFGAYAKYGQQFIYEFLRPLAFTTITSKFTLKVLLFISNYYLFWTVLLFFGCPTFFGLFYLIPTFFWGCSRFPKKCWTPRAYLIWNNWTNTECHFILSLVK